MNDEKQQRIFTENLNRLIEQSGKTQKEIADAIGVSTQTFNTWVKGKYIPRMGKVQKLADYFHVGKSALIEEEPSPYAYRSGTDDAKLLFNFNLLSEENKKLVLELIEKLLPR